MTFSLNLCRHGVNHQLGCFGKTRQGGTSPQAGQNGNTVPHSPNKEVGEVTIHVSPEEFIRGEGEILGEIER
ncbi:hypothetical protein L1887_22543 [Cichorium endivia]|nr:hypothetical protein L1887_22543 [Cichorium endivia]